MSAAVQQRFERAGEPTEGTQVMTYREALRLALREELHRDPKVFVMGEEIGVSRMLSGPNSLIRPAVTL